MANPITWQNVNAPSGAEALRGMYYAQQGITAAGDKLSELFAQRELANQGIQDRAAEGRTLAFKEALQGAGSIEALDALIKSGSLDTQRAGLDNKGRLAVLGMEDARRTGLRQDFIAADAHRQVQLENEYRPLIALAQQASQAGDLETANNLISQLPDAYKAKGSLLVGASKGFDDAVTRRQTELKNIQDLAASKANVAAQEITAQAAASNAQTSAQRVKNEEASKIRDDLANITQAQLKSNEGYVGSASANKQAMDWINSLKDSDHRRQLTEYAGLALAENKGMPIGAFMAQLQASPQLRFWERGTTGDTLSARLAKVAGGQDYVLENANRNKDYDFQRRVLRESLSQLGVKVPEIPTSPESTATATTKDELKQTTTFNDIINKRALKTENVTPATRALLEERLALDQEGIKNGQLKRLSPEAAAIQTLQKTELQEKTENDFKAQLASTRTQKYRDGLDLKRASRAEIAAHEAKMRDLEINPPKPLDVGDYLARRADLERREAAAKKAK